MRPKAKYAVIHRHRGEYPISVMCKFFGVSRSGYYCFKKRLGETDRDAVVAKEIEECQRRTDTCMEVVKRQKYSKRSEDCAQNHEKIWIIV